MLRDLTHDLQMFLDNIELRIENKNSSLGKTVLQLWTINYISPSNDLKKVQKTKKSKSWKNESILF